MLSTESWGERGGQQGPADIRECLWDPSFERTARNTPKEGVGSAERGPQHDAERGGNFQKEVNGSTQKILANKYQKKKKSGIYSPKGIVSVA